MSDQEPLFNLGVRAVPDENAEVALSGPNVEVSDARTDFVAGVLSQYVFGEKPTAAQRAAAKRVAREAIVRLTEFEA